MKPWALAAAISALTLVASAPRAAADADDCRRAVEEYNSTLNELSDYIVRYNRCVGSSRGTDDCSLEFRRVKNAQFDFESNVSDHQIYCRPY